MRYQKLCISVLLVAIAGGVLAGCNGKASHSDSETSTSYVYQFTAHCSGGDTVPGHANKMVLTQATGQREKVSVTDFYIDLGTAGNYKVIAPSTATWSGTPKKGGYTSVSGLQWGVNGRYSTFSGEIFWKTLDLDGDGNKEGKAIFYYD